MKVDGTKLLEEFRHHLAEHNLPATQQRLAVAEAVFFAGEHLSAEQVGRRVAKRVAVGTATIYRTLDLLRSEEHTSELQSRLHLVCRLLLEKKKKKKASIVQIQLLGLV